MNAHSDYGTGRRARLALLLFLLSFGCSGGGQSPMVGLLDAIQADSSAAAAGFSTSSTTLVSSSGERLYIVGAGMYDITGPAAEVGMMGFAESAQQTEGIYMRQWSRAFIIGDGTRRVVFVSADLGMIFQSVKQGVSRRIAQDAELAPYYGESNVLLSATHTHSGAGGFSHYFLYNVTTSGFIEQNYNAIVDGIYRSIKLAHRNLAPGRVLVNSGELSGASMNRSPVAYDRNPPPERALHASNVDTTMTLLRLQAQDGRDIGMINWFAVHPTSVGPSNHLIGGDNKGLASYRFEKDFGADYRSDSTFVAAFAQSNAGDVTPNLWGPADGVHDYERLAIIAGKQYDRARQLFASASEPLQGAVDFRHAYIDMSGLSVQSAGRSTCKAAMGASFSAGSVEDNAVSNHFFDEGTTVDSVQWTSNQRDAFLSSFLAGMLGFAWPSTLDAAYVACHAEKPILLPTGLASFDGNPWTPPIVPVQILKVGDLSIVAVPAEVTTMAGRRLRSTVESALGGRAVIAGLSNTYTSYLTTREEYASQQYEGASVQFGPDTLAAYQQEFGRLAAAMRDGAAVPPGPTPRDLTGYQATFQSGVAFDDVPWFQSFGSVITQPASSCVRGQTVQAVFWGAHPKNDLETRLGFVDVERLENGGWVVVAHDWDPTTTYRWARDGVANSKITVTWDSTGAPAGTYRLRHRGHWKSGWTGAITAYQGVTNTFLVK